VSDRCTNRTANIKFRLIRSDPNFRLIISIGLRSDTQLFLISILLSNVNRRHADFEFKSAIFNDHLQFFVLLFLCMEPSSYFGTKFTDCLSILNNCQGSPPSLCCRNMVYVMLISHGVINSMLPDCLTVFIDLTKTNQICVRSNLCVCVCVCVCLRACVRLKYIKLVCRRLMCFDSIGISSVF